MDLLNKKDKFNTHLLSNQIKMIKDIFVNLPVKNLEKTIEFFTKLGFKFNPKFTDENATCMIIGKNIFAMLLLEKFFQSFTSKAICDTTKSSEVILALSVDTKEKVDEMMSSVLSAGGKEPRPAQDHGWMYSRGFEDIDGHSWEIFFMDESEIK